jgi:hypothetical protein
MKTSLVIIMVVLTEIIIIIFVNSFIGNVIQPAQISTNNLTGLDSENWAGYIVETNFNQPSENSVDEISAYWNISGVDCFSFSKDYFSSFWIGIDGFSSRSISQIGTDSDCLLQAPIYYAWYEIYPQPPVLLNMTIHPKDQIFAEVKYIGGSNFQLTIKNLNTKESFSTIQEDSDAKRFSAEIIAEAPYLSDKSIARLSEFGPVEFHNINITINNVSKSISYKGWEYQKIIMTDKSGFIEAVPTDLSNGGRDFSIIWERST